MLILDKNDFEIKKNLNRFEIKVFDFKMLDSIKSLTDCRIVLLHKKKYIAKGNFYKSSVEPKGFDYFFPEDEKKHIKIWEDGLIILIPKTNGRLGNDTE